MIQKYLWAITGLKKQRKEASLHYPLKKERERAQKPYSQAGEINIFSLFLCRKKLLGQKYFRWKQKAGSLIITGNGTYSLLTDTITCLRQLGCPVVKKIKTNTVNKPSHSRLIHTENWNFILNSWKTVWRFIIPIYVVTILLFSNIHFSLF